MALKKTTKIVPKVDGKLNVLFVGDSQTDYSTSYANLLLGNEVTGTRISKIGAAMSVVTDYFKEGYVKGQFDIVSVMGGNNDATSKNFNKSFADIVKTVTDDGGKVVIITCPSVKYVNKGTNSNGKPYWPYFAKSKKTSSEYYGYADDIAKWQKGLAAKNVIIVDAHNQLDDSKNFDVDGLHLSANGQKELKKLWLTATSANSEFANGGVEKELEAAVIHKNKGGSQSVITSGTVSTNETGISDTTTYTEFTNKDFPTDIQTKCTFDVTKNTIYKSENGDSTIVNQTYIISNPAPDSKIIQKLDGTKIELGDLTFVKKEDPSDPEIIRLLTPYSTEKVDQLDPEFTEGGFTGTEDTKSLELLNENWETWSNPNYVPNVIAIEGSLVRASGDSGGDGEYSQSLEQETIKATGKWDEDNVKRLIGGSNWEAKAANIVAKFEAASKATLKAAWDVNHYRMGFGNEKIRKGGKIYEVTQNGPNSTCTAEEAIDTLSNYGVPLYSSVIAKAIGQSYWDKLTGNQKAALTSLGYNVGAGYISGREYGKKIKKAIIAGNMEDAANAILNGPRTAEGVVLKGLVDRRRKEAKLFLLPDNKSIYGDGTV